MAKASGDQLAALRERLDTLDEAWLAVLAERFQVTQQVSALKAEAQLPLRDPARGAAQLARIEAEAEAAACRPRWRGGFSSRSRRRWSPTMPPSSKRRRGTPPNFNFFARA